jgi:hypothetical protein
MGSGFNDWIYWHFFIITINYNSSHIELFLHDVCLTNLYEESWTNLSLIPDCLESVSELPYDWRFTANQFVLATSPLRLTTSNFINQLSTCVYSHYVTSSLTRGWFCRLQLLLFLASSVILRSESRGTHDHILLPQIRDSPNPEGQLPVFITPKNRVAQLYSQVLDSVFVASYHCHAARIEITASKS